MSYKSKRSQATNFTNETKQEMLERDRYSCIFQGPGCGGGLTPAHFIGRGQGGLGIKENGACVCMAHHTQLDHSTDRAGMLKEFRRYLERHYPGFTDTDRTYQKDAEYK